MIIYIEYTWFVAHTETPEKYITAPLLTKHNTMNYGFGSLSTDNILHKMIFNNSYIGMVFYSWGGKKIYWE